MSCFPTAAYLAWWAGMCPGHDESAGKRNSGKTRKGNPWLRATLVEAAHAAARTRRSHLNVQYHRIAARRGRKRAAVAVGHTTLVAIYHMLQRKTGPLARLLRPQEPAGPGVPPGPANRSSGLQGSGGAGCLAAHT